MIISELISLVNSHNKLKLFFQDAATIVILDILLSVSAAQFWTLRLSAKLLAFLRNIITIRTKDLSETNRIILAFKTLDILW